MINSGWRGEYYYSKTSKDAASSSSGSSAACILNPRRGNAYATLTWSAFRTATSLIRTPAGRVLSFLRALMPSLKLADGQGNDQDQDDSQSGQPRRVFFLIVSCFAVSPFT